MPEAFAEKSFDQVAPALSRSVVDLPKADENGAFTPPSSYLGPSGTDSILWYVSQVADEIQPWGTNPTKRDQQLRAFLSSESTICSAITSVAARDAGYTWALDGPPRTVATAHDMLHNANMGAGWMDFIISLAMDLRTQDKGAFVELIRQDPNSPTSPVIGIQALDAGRCWHTGDPEYPVVYLDRKGRYHRMGWWQVRTVAEIPTAHETLYGLQMCALTRILEAARYFRDIVIFQREKAGGRNTRAIHVVSGVNDAAMQAAIRRTQEEAYNRSQLRYIQPVIMTTLKPDAAVSVATLDLASLPDGFNAEQAFKQYLTLISLGLFTDFQEFAPLPGGGLGTSMQSEILHLKGQGKGPQLFRKLIEHLMNWGGVLPRNVEFRFDEQDIDAEKAKEDVGLVRAQRLTMLVEKGVIDASAARQLLLDAGDLPQEVFDRLDAQEMLGDQTGPNQVSQMDTQVVTPEQSGQPMSPTEAVVQKPQPQPVQEGERLPGQKAADDGEDRAGPEKARLDFEDEVAVAAEGAFATARATIQKLLKG